MPETERLCIMCQRVLWMNACLKLTFSDILQRRKRSVTLPELVHSCDMCTERDICDKNLPWSLKKRKVSIEFFCHAKIKSIYTQSFFHGLYHSESMDHFSYITFLIAWFPLSISIITCCYISQTLLLLVLYILLSKFSCSSKGWSLTVISMVRL